eukprot:scaffold24519_cov53-Attheya_sp.AAC.3
MGLSTSVSLAMMIIAYLAMIPDMAFSFAPPTTLVSKPAAFVSCVAAKSEVRSVRYPLPTGRLFAESESSADANDETDGSEEEETPVVEQPAAAAAASPAVPRAPPAPRAKRMDPLMASLTRDDSGSSGGDSKKMNVPLFGEVEVDGSLVVLAPAIVIGIVGFIMSINVALNSKDAISSSLSQYSESANNAAISRTNVVPGDGSCRGLCSSQESDLEGLRGFMTGISKK